MISLKRRATGKFKNCTRLNEERIGTTETPMLQMFDDELDNPAVTYYIAVFVLGKNAVNAWVDSGLRLPVSFGLIAAV
jgi:hypothetical protein